MAVFPYFRKKPQTGGRVEYFPQAISAMDTAVREQVAAWLLQEHQGYTREVALYYAEVKQRNITTEPMTGPEIRAYEVARNLMAYAEKGIAWDATVTKWLDILDGVWTPVRKLLSTTGEVLTDGAGKS